MRPCACKLYGAGSRWARSMHSGTLPRRSITKQCTTPSSSGRATTASPRPFTSHRAAGRSRSSNRQPSQAARSRPARITLPGFRHDLCAMNLSMFAGSAFFADYKDELFAHGLALVPASDSLTPGRGIAAISPKDAEAGGDAERRGGKLRGEVDCTRRALVCVGIQVMPACKWLSSALPVLTYPNVCMSLSQSRCALASATELISGADRTKSAPGHRRAMDAVSVLRG